MRDLIEPLINKGKTDREMIFRIEKAEEARAIRELGEARVASAGGYGETG